MSADNFTGQFISSTFQRLLQLSDNGDYVTDGTGSVVDLISVTSSQALTASYVPGVTVTNPGGGLWSIQFNSASTFQGTNKLLFNSASSALTLTGSILISGSGTEAYISTLNWIDFNPNIVVDPPFTTGRLHWVDDTKTLGLDTDVNGSVIELGHQHVVRVVNQTGVTIQQGRVVYISGSQGTRPGIATASYTDENDSATTLGFVMHDIVGSGGNTNGYVVTRGMLRAVNTFGLPAGASLYLSSSGQYTTTKPQAPLHDVRLGKVIVGNSTNAGVIYVDIQNGYEIDELHNVRIVNDTNGDLLTKSGSLWINTKQLSGSYGITGSLNVSGSTTLVGHLLVKPSGSAASASIDTLAGTLSNISTDPLYKGVSVDWYQRRLYHPFNGESLNWVGRELVNSVALVTLNWESSFLLTGGVYSVDWANRLSYDGSSTIALDWNSRYLYDYTGTAISVDWNNRQLTDGTQIAVDWANRSLYNSSGGPTVDWNASLLKDSAPGAISSLDWNNRQLLKVDGTPVLEWGGLFGADITFTGTSSYATLAETASYVNTLNQTVIVSGSVDISGSLFLNGVAIGGAGAETDPVYTAQKPTLATTGSNIFKGDQYITGSVYITGSFGLTPYGSAPTNPPPQKGLFYFTDTDLYISLD